MQRDTHPVDGLFDGGADAGESVTPHENDRVGWEGCGLRRAGRQVVLDVGRDARNHAARVEAGGEPSAQMLVGDEQVVAGIR